MIYAKDMIFLVVVQISGHFQIQLINELKNFDILVTVYSGKNIPIKEAQNLWEKKVTSVFVDDPTNYLDYFYSLGIPTILKPQST